ncbi:ORF6N domain-containing protein [Sporosarcina sp. FSL W7-1283]|uniref:ORF6N domain-containing protein n=1 Tax=Sporosarcina sp. FSL W7-1283 TaxID=2921560 RepID=UPI0030F7EC41
MGELMIGNNLEVNGVTVPNINGGFGVDKKAMLAKHIAEIHGKELSSVNRAVNMNRDRFKNNVDIIDLKEDTFAMHLVQSGIFTKNAVNAATNIYLLSERGYAKLIKIFNDDKSWDIYDDMLDQYFDMRDGNIEPINNKPMSPAEMLVVYAQQFLEQEQRLNKMEEEAKETNSKVVYLETEMNKETVSEGYVTNDNVARSLKLFSASDKPHSQFVDTIAQQLRIYNTRIGYVDEYVKVVRQTVTGGFVTGVAYYSPKGIELIKDFVENKFEPAQTNYIRGEKAGKFNTSHFKLGSKIFRFSEETQRIYG